MHRTQSPSPLRGARSLRPACGCEGEKPEGRERMVRVIVAVVLAAVLQFAWGFLFYGYFSGIHYMTSRAPDEAALTEALKSTLTESGTYIAPMCPGVNATEEATQAHEQRAAQGPSVQIHYRKEGFSMSQMPVVMGMGFGHML